MLHFLTLVPPEAAAGVIGVGSVGLIVARSKGPWFVALLLASVLTPRVAGVGAEGVHLQVDVPSGDHHDPDLLWPEEQLPARVDLRGLAALDGMAPEEAFPAGRRAIARWNDAAGRSLLRSTLGPDGGPVRVDACPLPSRDDGPGEHLALGSVEPWGRRTDPTAVGARVCVRDDPGMFAVDGAPDRYDLETLLVHEFGHVLGLSHPPADVCRRHEDTPMMCQGMSPGEIRRGLQASDVIAIRDRYPPGDHAPVNRAEPPHVHATGAWGPTTVADVPLVRHPDFGKTPILGELERSTNRLQREEGRRV